jgi:hypothetical protein
MWGCLRVDFRSSLQRHETTHAIKLGTFSELTGVRLA